MSALDLDRAVASRQATYRFDLSNAATGELLGEIHPIRTASLMHSTQSTVKRQLSLPLGRADVAAINALTDRVEPFMVFPGLGAYPLGRYMFADASRQVSTGGALGSMMLTDEMLLIDQQIEEGLSGVGRPVITVIQDAVSGLPVDLIVEPTPYRSAEAWGIGARRGQILESLSVSGDYWSPWLDNLGRLRFMRTFDPATRPVDIDLDEGAGVIRNSIVETDGILTAPNTIIVIGNTPGASADVGPAVGRATVPPTAPNSVANRGFAIVETFDMPVSDPGQAQAIADGLVQRMAVYEQVSLSTAPDPRFDSYDVVRWRGVNWLDLGWSLRLQEGEAMTHQMRRSYAA